jgi:hypothetical protein
MQPLELYSVDVGHRPNHVKYVSILLFRTFVFNLFDIYLFFHFKGNNETPPRQHCPS